MTPTLWSGVILVITLAGILTVRKLSKKVRIAFDVVCLAALTALLYRLGISPLVHAAAPDAPGIWLRAVIVTWWLVASRVVVAILYFVLHHDSRSREDRLLFDLTAAAIYLGAGLVVVKSALALPVEGLLATSGIVAIVLGLALQNTLADVFAGIAVGIEAPFRVGDRVSLGNNIEGQVVEMNWRSVRVQTDGHDIAIVPNSVIAKLEIVNRSVPSRVRSVSVEVWCPASANSDRVIDVLMQATLLCPDILEAPASSVLLSRIEKNWHRYSISFSVQDTSLVSAAKSLMLRHAVNQLHHAGVLVPRRKEPAVPAEPPATAAALSVLRELILFESLGSAELQKLAQDVAIRSLEPGDVLFSQGDADGTLYVVASGIVEVTKSLAPGSTITLGRLGAGEYLGEIGLLTGARHAATARACTHCSIYVLSRDAIAPLLESKTELAAAFDQSVRRGLDLLRRRVAVSATESVGTRGELLQRIREFFHFRPDR
jgi:small-conductance mechanosensitive channel/CRP-like cAMP-binding protein